MQTNLSRIVFSIVVFAGTFLFSQKVIVPNLLTLEDIKPETQLAQVAQTASCTHYASPNGGGNGLSQSSPFQIANFWSVAGPGKTLCLLDGIYTGGNSMITPPSGLGGSSGNPITIRALNDGSVGINGQSARQPLKFNNNSWWIVEGVNLYNGSNNVVEVWTNSNNNIFRRIVAWDAPVTDNAMLFLNGQNTGNLYEDIAGFGNARKIFEWYNGGASGTVTIRRAWGQFSANTWSSPGGPKMVYSNMYNSRNALYENLIGNWDKTSTSPVEDYGLFSGDQINDGGTHCINHRNYGSIGYIKASDNADTLNAYAAAHGWYDQDCLDFKNLVMYIQPGSHTGISPFIGDNYQGGRTYAYLSNVTTISSASPSIAGDWTQSNNSFVSSVAAAPNIWNGAGTSGARVCKQYVNGTLTNNPLWPWPMDARIRAAVIASGRSADSIFGGTGNSVTQQMEQIFGAIPSECRTGGTTVTPAPTVSLSANPTSVTSGTASTLSWSSSNATSCTASGAWSGTKATSGSQSTGNLTANSTFTLSCTGTGGTTNQSVNITVTAPIITTGNTSSCTHYASPTGGGNGLSQSSPFQIANFWSVAGPGKTLCLLDGIYTGGNSMIASPSGLSGSSGNPITIRALNDGMARIDGQSSNKPVGLSGNSWFVIEGIDAYNSGQASAFGVSNGSNNVTVRRVVVWNGQNANNGTVSIYNSSNTLFEDIAAFGTARNNFQLTQSANSFTVRRAWGMYEYDTSSTGPEAVFEAMYNSSNNRFENVIGTWADSTTAVNPYGVFFIGDEGTGHEILGSIFYVKNSSSFVPSDLVYHNANNGISIRDVVAYTAQASKIPFGLGNSSGGSKVFANNTEIGGSASSVGGNWSISNRIDVDTVSQAPNIWNGSGTQGARVCKQYVNGTLTSNPLWPWPMDARIRQALTRAGKNPDAVFGGTGNSVTQQMEQIFGAIPSECRTGGTTNPVPTVSLSASPTSVTSGTASTLTWSSANATSCTASGAWSGTKTVSGTQSTGSLTTSSTFTLSCTGSGGTASQSATVNVTAPTAFDFTLSNGGNKSVTQGSSVTNSITATLSSGTTQSTGFAVSGLPSGATASFSPTACSPTCSSTLTINTLSTTPTGNYTITVTATGGSITRISTFTLTVNAPTTTSSSISAFKTLSPITIDGNLNESVWSSANSVTFSGSNNTVKVSTLWDNTNLYFAYDVTDSQLEALNIATALWQDDSAEIYIDTQNNKTTTMDANDFYFFSNINNIVFPSSITGRTLTKTGGYTMEIKIPWSSISTIPQANKILGLLLANNDRDGGVIKQFDWMDIVATESYSQPNLWGSLTLSGTTVGATQSSTKFSINDRVQVSSGPLNVRSTANGTLLGTQATNALGTVIGGPTNAGGYNWWNINYDSGVDGWSAEDYLIKYITSATPTVSISANPTSVTSGSASTLSWSSANATVCTASGAWSGTKATSGSQTVSPTATTIYTLTCTGTGGTASQSTTVSVTAPTAFNFTLSNGGNKSVTQGSSVTNSITATLSSGTSQSTGFTVSGLPTGATGSFSSTACSPTCSTTLTINTLSSTPTGNYTITITAIGGSVIKTSTFILTVNAPTVTTTTSEATTLMDFNSGSGTSLPGWTYWASGADDYGSPGWRKDSGRFVSGNTNWMPRIMSYNSYGQDVLGTIDTANRAPSTSSGGSLRVSDTGKSSVQQAAWWWINDTNFGSQGLANANTDRLDFYFKTQGLTTNPGLEGSEPSSYNIHIGTYLCWPGGGYGGGEGCPTEASGQHYYHYLTIHDGAWLRVVLDRHPQWLRDCCEPSDNPAGSSRPYFQNMNSLYLMIRDDQPNNTSFWVDEMRFSQSTQPENDISISSVWTGYWASTNSWEIGFNDTSFPHGSYNDTSMSSFEIRYSNAPITNANFSSATAITPLYHGYGSAGRIKRPNPWKLPAWTRFTLPSSFNAPGAHVYFAIKDVSSTANGDGHNSPSSYVKTIDYVVPGGTGVPTPTPTVSLTASPTSITSGTAATLSWSSSNATSCTASGGPASPSQGGWSGTKSTSGSQSTGNLTANSTFTLSCTGTGGTTNQSVIVNVTAPVTDTTAPIISNISASQITLSTAQISWTTNENADSRVEYGLSSTYTSLSPLNPALLTSHFQVLTSLLPSTTYHYRVKSKNAAGLEAVSGDLTFTTASPPDTTPPFQITNLASSNITSNSVTLTWSAPGDNQNTSSYEIRYGNTPITSQNFSSQTLLQNPPLPKAPGLSESITIGSLLPSSTYHFAIRSKDNAGNASVLSNIISITTLPASVIRDILPPSLSGIAHSSIATSSARIIWQTNEAADSKVILGKSAAQLDMQTLSSFFGQSHDLLFPGLKRKTTYFYRVVSKDLEGNTATSSVFSFKTATGTPPKILAVLARQGSVILSWQVPDDLFIRQVRIYRRTDRYPVASDDASLLATIIDLTQTQYTDVSAVDGTTYFYSIFAIDDENIFSEPAEISFTPQAPQAPQTSQSSQSSRSSGGGASRSSASPSTVLIRTPAVQTITNVTLTGPFGPGVSGAQVTLLQQTLVRDGVYPEATVTGYYGSATQSAVRRFQQKYGIEATGIAGPLTRAKLNELYSEVPTLTPVAEAQRQERIRQIKTLLAQLIEQLIVLLQAQLPRN